MENSDELLIFMNIVIEEQDYCQGVVFYINVRIKRKLKKKIV